MRNKQPGSLFGSFDTFDWCLYGYAKIITGFNQVRSDVHIANMKLALLGL